MSEGTLVLLGALVGGAAGMAGTIVTAMFTNRGERRRLAVETGLREWEQAAQMALAANAKGRAAELYPPVLFMYFNTQLIRLLDSRRGLTTDNYRELVRRKDAIREVIRRESERSKA